MKSFRLAPVAALLCSICVVQSASATISRFDRMYVFGDSLSDGGNAWNLTQYVAGSGTGFPPSPPYAQRLSNGPTAAEQLAGLYGVPSAPSFSGGFNYAVGGATTQTLTVPYNPFPPVPTTPPGTIDTSNFIPFNYWYLQPQYNISALTNTGLQSQVGQFASSSPKAFDPDRSLFMVWGGANDFFMFPALAPSAVPGAVLNAASQIGSFVDTLYANGARIFLVPNLPDLAETPDSAGLGTDEKAALTALTQYFNGALDAQLDARRLAYGDITLIDFDTFAGFNSILDDPTAYKLTNVTDSCLASGALCNPDTFLFWDEVHPTQKGHQIIAEQFYTRIEAAIPEPETYALIAAGLLLVSWQARRRTVN